MSNKTNKVAQDPNRKPLCRIFCIRHHMDEQNLYLSSLKNLAKKFGRIDHTGGLIERAV